eukprot:7603604-Prorocentrum_lima.AAC.1
MLSVATKTHRHDHPGRLPGFNGTARAAPSATPTSQTLSLAGVAPLDDALARRVAEQRPVIVAF